MKILRLKTLLKILSVLFLASNLSCIKNSRNEILETNSFYTIPFAEIVKTKSEVRLSEFATDVEFIQFENTLLPLV
ncbi:MAG: hypothetical protein PF572_03940 [Patescibacteria group bacterium]|nr:hypothetical protein [Patescibacteria group bacterium]